MSLKPILTEHARCNTILAQWYYAVRGLTMRTISLKLPSELDQRVTALAEKRGTSRSAIVREALEAYANGHSESVTALAGDLVGSVDGPKDLSTATEHLKGYGQ